MIYIEIAVAVLAIAGTVLPAVGKIPRNRIVGVRTRATLASDTAWREGHRATILPMTLTGGIAIVGGTVLAVLGFVNEPFVVIVLAFVLLSGAAWSSAAARRAIPEASTK
ncbi:SdpI family protein [Microbacterium sp. IEGM 1404]|uniref:SdpI family protein n=1 Tax=Microbacterium sp. IEGM 1404 TaxID=3047084 RepID=UPI0024B76757|nr:SdpI family protein [Microbacterium sp. IEGM 1404]MDI9891585.1 SdpI family protein [Microbacterium sp. IEGM 1404]